MEPNTHQILIQMVERGTQEGVELYSILKTF